MKKIILFCFTFLLLICPNSIAKSATTSDYTVTPLIDNQNNQRKVNMYFDLILKPTEKKKITVVINNKSEKSEQFIVEANQATTSSSGTIDYGEYTKANKLNTNFEKILDKRRQKITIPAHSSRNVDLTLTMPKKQFSGMILGAFHVFKTVKQDSSDSIVKNTFAYNIAIVLRNNNKIPATNLSLSNAKIESKKAALTYSLSNNSKKIEPKLNIKSQLYKEKESEPIFTESKSNLTIAPKSQLKYTTDSLTNYLAPGKYNLKLTVKTSTNTYKFSKKISITSTQSQDVNKKNGAKKPVNWLYIGLVSMILLLIIIIIILKRQLAISRKEEHFETKE